jgi:hypothetical protein
MTIDSYILTMDRGVGVLGRVVANYVFVLGLKYGLGLGNRELLKERN